MPHAWQVVVVRFGRVPLGAGGVAVAPALVPHDVRNVGNETLKIVLPRGRSSPGTMTVVDASWAL